MSRELLSTKVTSRVAPFAFGAAGMTTTTTASTTLCVLTHEKLVDSRPIAERLRAETPSAFDIVVGSRVEDFDDAISGAGEARDVALLWWFAPRALAEGVMTAAGARRALGTRAVDAQWKRGCGTSVGDTEREGAFERDDERARGVFGELGRVGGVRAAYSAVCGSGAASGAARVEVDSNDGGDDSRGKRCSSSGTGTSGNTWRDERKRWGCA